MPIHCKALQGVLVLAQRTRQSKRECHSARVANVAVLSPAAPPLWRHAAAWPRMALHAASCCSACASADTAGKGGQASHASSGLPHASSGGILVPISMAGAESLPEQIRLGVATCKVVILTHCVSCDGERGAEWWDTLEGALHL